MCNIQTTGDGNSTFLFCQFHLLSFYSSPPTLLTDEAIKTLLHTLYDTLSDAKYSVIRTTSLDVLTELINRTEGTPLLQPYIEEIAKQVQSVAVSAEGNTIQMKVDGIKNLLIDHPSKKRKS